MQPPLSVLQAPSQYSQMAMLSVGCLVATASIWCGARGAPWPCLFLDILAKPTPGLLKVPVMANSGAGNSPALTLFSPAVPSAGLEAWFGALAEISPIQTKKPSEDEGSLWVGHARWLLSLLRGRWYTRLDYGCLIAGDGRELSVWTVKSSHIGCFERVGQFFLSLAVNSAFWTSIWTKPACVWQRQEQCSQAVIPFYYRQQHL